MSLYNIPVYYISFNKNKKLEDNLLSVGFTNINHFNAIDGRKMVPKKLLDDKLISIRSYNDLISGKRSEHSGIPSLGAVGCTLSHYELWKKCINDLDNIIIIEEDADISRKITDEELLIINEALSKKNGGIISPIYVDVKEDKQINTIWGTQFYICSKEMCSKLVKYAFPMDVQTDAYICHLSNIKEIDLTILSIYGQKLHKSSIQDICIKCILPNNRNFYMILFIILCILLYYSIKYFKRCSSNSMCC